MKTMDDVEERFTYKHLPEDLQTISKPFHDQAKLTFISIGPGPACTRALNYLWQAKNETVWAWMQQQQGREV